MSATNSPESQTPQQVEDQNPLPASVNAELPTNNLVPSSQPVEGTAQPANEVPAQEPTPASSFQQNEHSAGPRRQGLLGWFVDTKAGRITGGATAVASVAGAIGIGMALGSSSSASPRKGVAVEQSADPSATQSPSSVETNVGTQKPSNSPSPTPTSIPTVAETTPASNTTDDEQPKDPSQLGPTTPEAIPYVEGKAPTPEDVKILMHNIEVAANTGNLSNLLYSGIYPDSELANNVNTYFVQYYQNEKQQIGAMAGPFNIKINDNDVMIDPSNVAHVRTAIGTDFDFTYTSAAKPRVNYTEYSFTVGSRTVTLPDGTSKNLLALVGSMSSTPSSYQEWNSGF